MKAKILYPTVGFMVAFLFTGISANENVPRQNYVPINKEKLDQDMAQMQLNRSINESLKSFEPVFEKRDSIFELVRSRVEKNRAELK